MQAALGETHPLVKLTLDCLEFDLRERPSAVEVLRRLEEVEVPQNCTETKLELIRQISGRDEEIEQNLVEHHRQISEKNSLIQRQMSEKDTLQRKLTEVQATNIQLQATNNRLQATVDCLQATVDHLQAEKQVEGYQGLRQRDMSVEKKQVR